MLLSIDPDCRPAPHGIEVIGPSNASWSRVYGWYHGEQHVWLMTTVYRDGRSTMRLDANCSLVVRNQ
jgi:hypothetical protein